MDMDWPAVDCVLPYARAGVYAFRTCGEGFADGDLERCVLGKNVEVFDSPFVEFLARTVHTEPPS